MVILLSGNKLTNKIVDPQSHVIEKTAMELACVWYETGRSQGMTSKYKSAPAFARANVERFIPRALSHLIDILGNENTPEAMKREIYDAIMERNNDPTLAQTGLYAENPFAYKSDQGVKPAPIIINTIDFKKVI